MKFDAHADFRRDLTRVRVLYEATTQAYETLHRTGKDVLRKPDHPHNVEFKVGTKTIKRPWKSVTYHARDIYPKTLRSVILVQAISIYEVFLVAVVEEMATRTKQWLKDDGRIEMSHSQLLTIAWNQGLEAYILQKHLNGLTRGSLADKRKFFRTKFQTDLASSDATYAQLDEVHDRRNLYVHRVGYPDALFLRKHASSGAREGQKVLISDDYLESVFSTLEASARHIVRQLESQHPEKIVPNYAAGSAQLAVSAHQVHITTVRCLSEAALATMRDKSRPLADGHPLEDVLVWLAVTDQRITYLVSGEGVGLKPFFKQIARDEKAGDIKIEQSFRVNRRNVRRINLAPAETSQVRGASPAEPKLQDDPATTSSRTTDE
ncbi:MAG TPA: hypothetical protein VF702_04170 [Allosphingosinicella sp.]|jgi:hypothetical protein